MKKLVRIRCQKVMLIFDESDTISNGSSKRTKAMLSVFRKCRYKVLATGTMTRNNVVEAAPQLELLYNNSIHYLAKNEWIFRFRNGQMEKYANPFFNQPFPAYKKGYELFSFSYLPKKITVFGLEKANQDIYNSSFLDELLEKTVITKNFEEVVGRKIYRCWGQKPCYSTLKILHKFFNFPQMWYTVYINQRWWKCMAFRTNSYQQLSFADSFEGLTFREQKALEHSWAKVFAEDIFPAINEEPFRVLYSSNASRPNTPVNVCIGALIIKELFGISDDEVVENLMLDPRYQYALHTSSFEEQPLSDKTLTRFRKRCYDYESIHGIDLLHECMTGLGTNIAKLMDISPRVKRMDSMMIAANIRKLSRIELLYTCVKKLVIYFHKNSRDELIKGMEHYCDPNDYNKTFYYSNDSDTENHLAAILKDADRLLDLCGTDYDDITEYQLLVRCLSEQTIVEEGFRRLRTKEDGGFHSGILQNPSDPDATYRSKAGKEHQGYVANLEETVDRNGSVITDYQFEQNIYSDSRFLKDSLERTEVQEKKSTLITDGAYSGKENHDLAAQKNIRLINTDLSGKPVDDILADFVFNETGTKVVRCPAGYEPKSCGYTGDKSQQFHVSFQKEQCANCPHKAQCKAKIYKRVSRVTVSVKSHERAKQQRFMGTEEFRNLFKIRNGVETLPSLLRRRYHADRMSVRGLIRGRFFFGCKIGALNFKKLFTYRKGLGHYAQNPVLA